MNLIAKLFNKTPSVLDIRLHLKEIEREQAKQRRQLDVLAQTKQAKVNEAVGCKRAGKQEQVIEAFCEIRQIEIDISNANIDLRRISLSKTALASFLRKAQMLEEKKDRKSLQNLAARFRDISFQRTIDAAEVDDDSFNDMLKEILGEVEVAAVEGKTIEDPGFAEFDRAISQMAEADASRTVKGIKSERFSLVNGAGLKSKADHETADRVAEICGCSHGVDECWHHGRSPKTKTQDIADERAEICGCSHGIDDCYHQGRKAKGAAETQAEGCAGSHCVGGHDIDDCWHHKPRGG
jgi:hypothetical protein